MRPGDQQSTLVDIAVVAETNDTILAFTDSQLRSVWAAADGLPVEKRGIFLGHLIAHLQLHGDSFTPTDLEDVVRLALKGLTQKSAA